MTILTYSCMNHNKKFKHLDELAEHIEESGIHYVQTFKRDVIPRPSLTDVQY